METGFGSSLNGRRFDQDKENTSEHNKLVVLIKEKEKKNYKKLLRNSG